MRILKKSKGPYWIPLWSKTIRCVKCSYTTTNPKDKLGIYSPCPRCFNETATYVFVAGSLEKVQDRSQYQHGGRDL